MTSFLFLITFFLVGACLCAPDSARSLLSPSWISDLKFAGVSLRAPGALRDLLAASQISNMKSHRPASAPGSSSHPPAPHPSTPSTLSTTSSSIRNSAHVLLPEPLAGALEALTAELRHRLDFYEFLAPAAVAPRARRDARFAVRLRAIYVTIDRVYRADPGARPLDPADFLPSFTATELARSEKYLAELTHAWRVYDAHPTGAEFDQALTALSRMTRLRRSLFDLTRLAPRPDTFPGWDADNHINPFDESFEPVFPDGVERPPAFPLDSEPLTPAQLIDRLLVPAASSTKSTSSTRSTVSTPSTSPTSPRRPRSLACIPRRLLRLLRRFGAWLLYLRPRYLNPFIGKLAYLAGMIVLYFPPPDGPPKKMSEAEIAWWKAEEKRRIRIVHRPEVEGRICGIPETSLPPWGFDDPPWER